MPLFSEAHSITGERVKLAHFTQGEQGPPCAGICPSYGIGLGQSRDSHQGLSAPKVHVLSSLALLCELQDRKRKKIEFGGVFPSSVDEKTEAQRGEGASNKHT